MDLQIRAHLADQSGDTKILNQHRVDAGSGHLLDHSPAADISEGKTNVFSVT